MKNKFGMVIWDNCATCQTWSAVEKGPDGKNYCAIHLAYKLDESIDENTRVKSDAYLNRFRKMTDIPLENPSHE